MVSGVDALIGKGFVDKDRVGAMGWSEGGYISAFITASSDRFKAVSVGAGISDWMTYYVNTDITPFTRQYLHATPWDDPEIYRKTSPIAYVLKARTYATLIQQGELEDRRVPIPNGCELRRATRGPRRAGQDGRITRASGHGIDKPKQQRAVMEEENESGLPNASSPHPRPFRQPEPGRGDALRRPRAPIRAHSRIRVTIWLRRSPCYPDAVRTTLRASAGRGDAMRRPFVWRGDMLAQVTGRCVVSIWTQNITLRVTMDRSASGTFVGDRSHG